MRRARACSDVRKGTCMCKKSLVLYLLLAKEHIGHDKGPHSSRGNMFVVFVIEGKADCIQLHATYYMNN